MEDALRKAIIKAEETSDNIKKMAIILFVFFISICPPRRNMFTILNIIILYIVNFRNIALYFFDLFVLYFFCNGCLDNNLFYEI